MPTKFLERSGKKEKEFCAPTVRVIPAVTDTLVAGKKIVLSATIDAIDSLLQKANARGEISWKKKNRTPCDLRQGDVKSAFPAFYFHPSFVAKDAEETYAVPPGAPASEIADDPLVRSWSKSMHYSALRIVQGKNDRQRHDWRARHELLMNRIVTNNQRLVADQVQTVVFAPELQREWDDWMSEGEQTLLKCAGLYNPWENINFSTYACNAIQSNLRRDIAIHLQHQRKLRFVSLQSGDALENPHAGETANLIEEMPGAEHEPLEMLIAQESLEALRTMTNALPENERRAIVGYYFEEKPQKSLAQELNMGRAGFHNFHQRVLAKLRIAMEKNA